MDSATWQAVFKSFRPEDHKQILLYTTFDLQIATEIISRIEEDVVIIRGRISGQAEQGRLFILPYSQIAGIIVNREVGVEEVELFSPSVSLERKAEVAKRVAELKEKARREAMEAEAEISGKGSGSTGGGGGQTFSELESLREKFQKEKGSPVETKEAPSETPAIAPPPEQPVERPVSEPRRPATSRPSSIPRMNIPRKPPRKE